MVIDFSYIRSAMLLQHDKFSIAIITFFGLSIRIAQRGKQYMMLGRWKRKAWYTWLNFQYEIRMFPSDIATILRTSPIEW